MRMRTSMMAVLAVVMAGCSPESDTDLLARVNDLKLEARALGNAAGCATVDQCRTAPVGSRPCGGPEDYVVYCSLTADEAALQAKLAELRQLEDEYNRKIGLISTCEITPPPALELVGGTCRAAGP